MRTLNKPTWWNALKAQYNFPDDGLPTIPSYDLLQTLASHVTGKFGDLLSPSFLATQRVAQDISGDANKPAIIISSATLASEVIGRLGSDYLSGSSADDIIYGGANNDFFMPRGGKDFVIGSATRGTSEKDTVSYETATNGIIVDYIAPSTSPAPYHNYYSASYSAWSAGTVLTITGFITGPGGDIINLYDLLSNVGYTGSNPVGNGYIRFSDISSGMKIQFDRDGSSSSAFGASQAVVLKGVRVADFSIADNLVTATPAPPPVQPTALNNDPSDYTLVSQDGYGDYDVLYSVENIIGSNLSDVIHGRDDTANILYGGAGNDFLYGEAGNDTLIGAQGDDTVYGGTGNDLFFMGAGNDQFYGEAGKDTYKFGADYLANAGPQTAAIHDFQVGANGDKIDVSELLKSIHYTGINAITDGYIGVRQGAGGAEIVFDKDGLGAAQSPTVLATLNGVNSSAFSMADNLVTQSSSIILASILGQSNAASLRVLAGDTKSGVTRLEDGLRNQTDFSKVYSVLRDENGAYLDIAVGGTVVNGDLNNDPSVVWWYPAANKPGELTIRATDMLITQIADLRAQGAVTPVLIWGQGESDAFAIGAASTSAARAAMQQTYMNATMSVFNYILDHVGRDVQIYIMETGNYSVAGALASNVSQSTIDKTVLGLNYIREAQEQMAMANANIHLATVYTDLAMFADLPSSTPGYESGWAQDQWHLSYDAKEIEGDRLADFIAQDLGFDHVINNPGPYPLNMLPDLTIVDGPGLVINGNGNNNIITGTTGADTIHGNEGADAIVSGGGDDALGGGTGVDTILAGAGNDTLDGGADADTLTGGTGADTFVFLEASAYSGLDIIKDFSVSEGDVIDIFGLLGAYGLNGGALGNFVQITEDGSGNSILSVDKDGAGLVYAPVQIVLLSGVTDLASVEALAASGNLHVPVYINPVIAQNDSFSADEDTQITGNVLLDNGNGADTGANGSLLAVQAGNFVTAHGGVVSLASDGSFTYNPALNYNGADRFTYSVSDGKGGSGAGSVNITLFAVNDAPDAKDDIFTTEQNTPLNGNALTNNGDDTDPDNDVLTVEAASFTTAFGGSVSINADGSFIYNPFENYLGPDSFTYVISDGHGGSDEGTVNIAVGRINDAPVAKNDIFSVRENLPLAGNVLADNGNGADTDADGNILTVLAGVFTTANGASVSIAADGNFTYNPAANYHGSDSFIYLVSDGFGGESGATVYVTVTSVNEAPQAKDDVFTAAYGQAISGNVFANNGNGADTDADNDLLSIIQLPIITTNGIVLSLGSNGSFTYNAPTDFVGADSFNYAVSDGQGETDIAMVTLNIVAPAASILGTSGNDTLSGTDAGEYVFALAGNDTLKGKGGDDILNGGAGDDIFEGNGGNDRITGGLGADRIKGSDGVDIYIYTSLAEGGDTLVDFNAQIGEKFDLTDLLDNSTDFIANRAFTDGYIRAAQSGTNVLLYGDVDGNAGAAAEVLLATLNNANASSLNLNHFILPTAVAPPPPDPVLPPPPPPPPQPMTISLLGTEGNDTLEGSSNADIMKGYGGNDTIRAGAGNDTIEGNAGNDHITGGAGADKIKAGGGADVLIYENILDGGDTISDYRTNDKIDLSVLVDTFSGINASATLNQLVSDGYLSTQTAGSVTSLYADADGRAGSAGAVLLADISTDKPFDISTIIV